MSKNTEAILVNLTDYRGGCRIQARGTQDEKHPELWEIELWDDSGADPIGAGSYLNSFGEGLRDFECEFSDLDWRLLNEAVGMMVAEFPAAQAEREEEEKSYREEREQEARLDAQDWKHQ